MAAQYDLLCFECKEKIISEEKLTVSCFGKCNQVFHMYCASVKKSEHNCLLNNKNLRWICDKCLNPSETASQNQFSEQLSANNYEELIKTQGLLITNLNTEVELLKVSLYNINGNLLNITSTLSIN